MRKREKEEKSMRERGRAIVAMTVEVVDKEGGGKR